MTFRYHQDSGELEHNGAIIGAGYSGIPSARNDGSQEAVPNVGPIPRGKYSIGTPYTHPHLGPIVMNLEPVGHDAHGRSAFRIHGDNVSHDASHGCIVLPRDVRKMIAESGDHELEVV